MLDDIFNITAKVDVGMTRFGSYLVKYLNEIEISLKPSIMKILYGLKVSNGASDYSLFYTLFMINF